MSFLSSLEPTLLYSGVHPFLPMLPFRSPSFSRQGAVLAHLDSHSPHDLVIWTDGSVPIRFGKGGSGILANCSLCGTETTLAFSTGPVCSSFSAEVCAVLHALRSTNKSATSLLLLSDSRSVLSSIFSFTSNSLADLEGTVFSLLLFYQATMGPRTLVSPGERRG